ncbi:MAG: acyl carrier protein [Rhodanobacteraceae bacterium]|nr:acyl carrier protein [Rhodanobacteraceae bacterium]
MTPQQIQNLIVSLFKEKESFKDIGLDEDYFDLGVSSLTIVGLQIQVEEQLGVNLSTRDLMLLSTINQWVQAYTAKCEELTSA